MVDRYYNRLDEEGDGFTIVFLSSGSVRISYFINYHFRDEIIIDLNMLDVI